MYKDKANTQNQMLLRIDNMVVFGIEAQMRFRTSSSRTHVYQEASSVKGIIPMLERNIRMGKRSKTDVNYLTIPSLNTTIMMVSLRTSFPIRNST